MTNQGKWTLEEDHKLKEAAILNNEKNWKGIANFVGTRSAVQCSHRWWKIIKPGVKKGPWTEEEDQILTDWVKSNGPIHWSKCAKLIEGRTGKQCRERWVNSLSPHVKKGNWSKEDDEFIIHMHKKHGPQWTKIARQLPGRTENSVKNRFNNMIRKVERIRNKTINEFDEENDEYMKLENLNNQVMDLEELLVSTKSQIESLETSLQNN